MMGLYQDEFLLEHKEPEKQHGQSADGTINMNFVSGFICGEK